MGCIRVPSPTPSVGSDGPISETLQEDPAGPLIPSGVGTRQLPEVSSGQMQLAVENPEAEDKEVWVIYVGDLHPKTKESDLYHLFNGRDRIGNIIIRTSRSCGVVPIPGRHTEPNDRCYASVEVIGWELTQEIIDSYDPANRPLIHGEPIVIALSAMDMPDYPEILKRVIKEQLKSTKEPILSERITAQKIMLAGPSRREARPKARHNPLRRSRAKPARL